LRVAPNVFLPALCSALSFTFALVLATRFFARGRPYYAAWALGLVWYGISTTAEWTGAAFGWSPDLYRCWYVTGALGVAAYLGAGSVYLHRSRTFGWLVLGGLAVGSLPALLAGYAVVGLLGLSGALLLAVVLVRWPVHFASTVLGLLILGSVLAGARVLLAPVDESLLPTADQVATGQAFAADVRTLTPLFNVAGATALLAGALVSAVHYWRTRAAAGQVVSNGLIVLGALVPSLTSGVTRFGWSGAFYLGELVGVACILAGFMLSGAPSAPPRPHPSASGGPSSGFAG
jgi:hypothetical protein